MQVLWVEFTIRDDKVAAFEAAIMANARASLREEPGCRQFDVCRDPADARRFLLYELYDDAASVQAHLQAPHFLAMDTLTRDWVLAKTVRRLTRMAT